MTGEIESLLKGWYILSPKRLQIGRCSGVYRQVCRDSITLEWYCKNIKLFIINTSALLSSQLPHLCNPVLMECGSNVQDIGVMDYFISVLDNDPAG